MNPLYFAGAFGLAIFGGTSLARFNRDAERDLAKKVEGDHKKIVVRAHPGFESIFAEIPSIDVEASDFSCASLPFHAEAHRSTYGKVRHLRFHLTHFVLHNLPVASMTADLRGTRFDFGYAVAHHHFRISRSGSGPLTVVLKLEDLKSFAIKHYPQIHDIEMGSAGGRLILSGSAAIGPFATKFNLSGRPGVESGTKLVLLDPQIVLNGKPMDEKSAESFIKPFSPIVDLDRDLGAEGGIQLSTMTLEGNSLIGVGTVHVPQLKPSPVGSPTLGASQVRS